MMRRKSWKSVLCLAASGFIVLVWSGSGLAIDNSECMDCHGDNSLRRQHSEGIAESLFVDGNKFKLSVHNINGVGCLDCHADITELDTSKDVPHSPSLAAVNCSGCHEAEGKAYVNSVHRKAGAKGISIPCYACHGYHYVPYLEPSSVFERENRFCLKCHDPNKFHDWLPQKENHFAHVECTVCHAPETARDIHLRLFDLVQNRFLSSKETLAALKSSREDFKKLVDKDGSGVIDAEEFENYILLLRQRGIRGTFHGELVSELSPSIHHVNRGEAKRDCQMCHVPTSPFFQTVSLIFENDEGGLDHFPVERQVLETYYVSHFYALGGTRIRILDKIGIALVAGGFLAAGTHLTIRILTIPWRKAKEKDKIPGASRIVSSIG